MYALPKHSRYTYERKYYKLFFFERIYNKLKFFEKDGINSNVEKKVKPDSSNYKSEELGNKYPFHYISGGNMCSIFLRQNVFYQMTSLWLQKVVIFHNLQIKSTNRILR